MTRHFAGAITQSRDSRAAALGRVSQRPATPRG
jgi:hypothetical protein